MVIAHLYDYHIIEDDNNHWEYVGKYSYTAPNGKQYKMKWRDRHFRKTPPETITLYLEKKNYRRYYTKESLNMGKHGGGLSILAYAVGFFLYLMLINYVIAPLILR